MEPNSELIIGHSMSAAAKRGPSSPKIIVDSNLSVQNSSAIRPTPVKAGKTITHLDSKSYTPPVNETQLPRVGKSLSPNPASSNFAVKAKVNQDHEVPERDTNHEEAKETSQGQLVTNVVIGEDSGFQILSSKDEEAEREKPKKVISTKIHKKKGFSSGASIAAATAAAASRQSHHEYHKDDLSQSLEKAKKLLDVKAAIEKLRLRGGGGGMESEDGTASELSTSSSVTSSSGSSDSDIAHIAPVNMPTSTAAAAAAGMSKSSSLANSELQGGKSSSKTVTGKQQSSSGNNQQPSHHPQVTSSADEFVWIDSYNRLVELQKLPWTHTDLCKAICQRTSMGENEVIGADLLSRLSYYLQRALVRIAREAQRLGKSVGKCGKQEISSALKVVLSPSLATLAVKACLRAAAMFSISNEDTRQTKSSRAGLLLHVGKVSVL